MIKKKKMEKCFLAYRRWDTRGEQTGNLRSKGIGRQWPRVVWEMIRFVGRVRVATACNVISTHTHIQAHALRSLASLDSQQFIWTIATSPPRYYVPPYHSSALYIYAQFGVTRRQWRWRRRRRRLSELRKLRQRRR